MNRHGSDCEDPALLPSWLGGGGMFSRYPPPQVPMPMLISNLIFYLPACYLCACLLTLFNQLVSMTQWSNLKEFSSQTYFFHSTGHYNECVAAHNSVPPDPTMTVDNITQIFNKIRGNKWKKVMDDLGIPQPLVKEIQRRYSTDTEKNHACADYYKNFHPYAEWKQLTVKLYVSREFAAARESKSFVSTGKHCHYIIYHSRNILYSLVCHAAYILGWASVI